MRDTERLRLPVTETIHDNTQELLRKMIAASPGVITRVVRFSNDDVPRYLAKLRRFREESRKVMIMVG